VPGSNQRPPACKAGALPTELTARAMSLAAQPCGFEPKRRGPFRGLSWSVVGIWSDSTEQTTGTENLSRWRNVLVPVQDVARVVAGLQGLETRE
jgi:hypothetical protein